MLKIKRNIKRVLELLELLESWNCCKVVMLEILIFNISTFQQFQLFNSFNSFNALFICSAVFSTAFNSFQQTMLKTCFQHQTKHPPGFFIEFF